MKITKPQIYLFLSLILLLSTWLRLDRLGDRSLWFDEIAQIERARYVSNIREAIILPLPSKENPLARTEPRLSLLILNYFIKKFGESEFTARIPSVIAGILTIIVIAITGKTIFGYKEGLISALLLAISPYHIYYSQEARPYVFLVLFSLCSFFFFYKLLFSKKPKWWYWLGFFLSTFLNISNSFISFHVISIIIIFTIIHFIFTRRTSYKIYFLWIIIIGFLSIIFRDYLFYAFRFAMRNLTKEHQVRFLVFNWGFLREILNCYLIPYNSGLNAKISLLFYLLAFFSGFIILYKDRWIQILFSVWIVLPFILIFTIFKPFEYYNPRYLIIILPAILLIISKGIVLYLDKIANLIGRRYIFSYSIGILLIIGLNTKPLFNYHYSEKDNWKDTAKYLEQKAASGDVILICPPGNYSCFNYYFNNIKNISVLTDFNQLTSEFCYTWIVSYSDEDWYWELHYKEAYKDYKSFREDLEVIQETKFTPHPLIIKSIFFKNKKKTELNLNQSLKDGIIFNPQYKIFHPEFYNKQGEFYIEINSPEGEFGRAFLKIKAYVIYRNNYVKLYLLDKRILYIKGKDCEIKKTRFIDVTDILKMDKKVIVKGKLFTDRKTSVELYDARIEEISLCYE